MRDAAIFDVDGTLQDVSSIRHFVTRPPGQKDFHSFHAAAVNCPLHHWVADLARQASVDGLDVLVVTARKRMWRYTTLWPLWFGGVPVDDLYMRDDADNRRDVLVKTDILTAIRRRYRVHFAVDDNPAVLALWRAEGIPTVEVPSWDDSVARE